LARRSGRPHELLCEPDLALNLDQAAVNVDAPVAGGDIDILQAVAPRARRLTRQLLALHDLPTPASLIRELALRLLGYRLGLGEQRPGGVVDVATDAVSGE
jgi:hypothetical protein